MERATKCLATVVFWKTSKEMSSGLDEILKLITKKKKKKKKRQAAGKTCEEGPSNTLLGGGRQKQNGTAKVLRCPPRPHEGSIMQLTTNIPQTARLRACAYVIGGAKEPVPGRLGVGDGLLRGERLHAKMVVIITIITIIITNSPIQVSPKSAARPWKRR